jgi:FkbM family methyltransferase
VVGFAAAPEGFLRFLLQGTLPTPVWAGAAMFRLFRRFVRPLLVERCGYGFRRTYSHDAEDRLATTFFAKQRAADFCGVYVDVGANHPVLSSTTYLLWRLGWRGVLVEPDPVMARALRRVRRGDIVMEAALAGSTGEREFLSYPIGEYNGFADLKPPPKRLQLEAVAGLPKASRVTTKTLAHACQRASDVFGSVDFLSIDCEGAEEEILGSNDWSRFRPLLIAVESLGMVPGEVLHSTLDALLGRVGYQLVAKTFLTSLYAPIEIGVPEASH